MNLSYSDEAILHPLGSFSFPDAFLSTTLCSYRAIGEPLALLFFFLGLELLPLEVVASKPVGNHSQMIPRELKSN